MTTMQAFTAYSRFGLGARKGDLALIGDPVSALIAELDDPARVNVVEPLLDGHAAIITTINKHFKDRAEARNSGQAKGAYKDPVKLWLNRQGPLERGVRVSQALAAPVGYTERLVAFWSNHFAIQGDMNEMSRALAGAFEREAIRPYVLGSFADMLLAVTTHPAMLRYLNNAVSVGPHSPQGSKLGLGLNENHARELLELHTLGVDGGYSQADVTALAAVLTGWTVHYRGDSAGQFVFRSEAHEPGAQSVAGKVYDQPGFEQGRAVLADLAASPITAQHLADKFVRHFMGDAPDPALVASLAGQLHDTGGNLAALAAGLVLSDAAWSTPPTRLKSPQEFLWSAIRALGVAPDGTQVQDLLEGMGQPLWNPSSPAGFPDAAMSWLGPEAMTARIDAAQTLALAATGPDDPVVVAQAVLGPALQPATQEAMERAESRTQALVLMLMSPEFQRR